MRIAINKKLCDNSSQCWFVKNCPHNVFEHNGQIVVIHEDRCTGCQKCHDHCNVVFVVADEEDYKQKKILLEQLESKDLSVDLFGTEPIRSQACIYYEGKEGNSYQSTIDTLKNTEDILQIIELSDNRSIVCKHKGHPFSVFKKDLETIISQIYCGTIVHRIIYTCDNTDMFKKFIKFFGAEDLEHNAPLLILYLNGKVLAKWGHGRITCDNYSRHKVSMQEEIKKQVAI